GRFEHCAGPATCSVFAAGWGLVSIPDRARSGSSEGIGGSTERSGLAFGVLISRVRRTIAERGLFGPGARLLVACSGGPDSAVLLHVLTRLAPELDLRLWVASVDHGLRPDAARDVAVARELADRLEVPFSALRVEV